MENRSAFRFAIWINWIFFSLFMVLSGISVWAILSQSDTSEVTKLEAIVLILLVTFVPAVIFMNNAILFIKITKQNSKPIQSTQLDGLK